MTRKKTTKATEPKADEIPRWCRIGAWQGAKQDHADARRFVRDGEDRPLYFDVRRETPIGGVVTTITTRTLIPKCLFDAVAKGVAKRMPAILAEALAEHEKRVEDLRLAAEKEARDVLEAVKP